MRALLFSLICALPRALFAQEALEPMAVDETPSVFACTMAKIARGDRCTYEGRPAQVQPPSLDARAQVQPPSLDARAQARENSRVAALAASACASAAGGKSADAAVRKQCEDQIAEASLSAPCTLDGAGALQDAEGRLAPQAQGCMERVGSALRSARDASALSVGCCRCLVQERCPVKLLACARELAELVPGKQTSACLARSCHDACGTWSSAASESPAPAPAPRRAAPSHPDKI